MPPVISKQQKSRERLQVLFEAGIVEAKKLHQKTKISLSTIYDVLAKLKRGEGIERSPGSGRPLKLQPNDLRRITQFAHHHDKWSAQRIVYQAYLRGSPKVSSRTIQRYLKERGYVKIVPKQVFLLTEEHKQKRLEFCYRYRNFDWTKCVFSDESKFQFYRTNVKVWGKGRKSVQKPK